MLVLVGSPGLPNGASDAPMSLNNNQYLCFIHRSDIKSAVQNFLDDGVRLTQKIASHPQIDDGVRLLAESAFN